MADNLKSRIEVYHTWEAFAAGNPDYDNYPSSRIGAAIIKGRIAEEGVAVVEKFPFSFNLPTHRDVCNYLRRWGIIREESKKSKLQFD